MNPWIKTQKPWILILVLTLRHHDVKRVTCLYFKLTALKIEIIACLESDHFWYTHVLQCTISTDYKPWDKTNLEITGYFSFRILILQRTITSIKYSPFQMWYQILSSSISSLTGHVILVVIQDSYCLEDWDDFYESQLFKDNLLNV